MIHQCGGYGEEGRRGGDVGYRVRISKDGDMIGEDGEHLTDRVRMFWVGLIRELLS